jgi:uncharacterized protein (TIGR01244 family)
MFKPLTSDYAVAGQLPPEAMTIAGTQGFVRVINNRPDGEEFGQPDSAAMQAAAEAAGLSYVHIPMGASGLSLEMIAATRLAMAQAGGPVLAFCRSGNRSAILWALASAADGKDPAELSALAAAAGYDLRPVAALMQDMQARQAT